jgi:capsular exopolysaccharide synthesis family protein
VTSLTSYYANNLDVEAVERGASIMNLSITTSNALMGEAYLNTLMQTYLDLELQDKNEVYSNTIKFIDGQVSGVADTLRFFEKELENYRSENKIYNLSTEGAAVFDQMSELETQLNNEEFKRKYYQSLKDYLLRENYKELVVPSGIGIDDPILNGLIENLLSLQVDKSRLLATQTEISPAVKEINRKIEDSNRSIREILNNVDQNSLMLIEDLRSRINQMDVSFRSLPETEQNLIRIERQFTLSENLYTYLQEKRAEAAITKASNTVNNKIIEPATGGFKITPKPLQNYTVAVLIGILFPLILIFLKEIFRTKIEDLKFLERRLRIPILSTILLNRSDNNLVVLNQGKSGISEGFRSLRANLKYVLQRDDKITMMVTSTISGEGKTFCAVNLASVYSLTGKKTVLVGCDMRKPKIFGDFHIENNKGLSTFLSGESNDWKEIISPSGYENLDILVAGPTPPNPAELLLSVRFTSLVEELKKEYDVIIMDTPPVGLVSETLDLLNHVDLTLFVFRQNYSQRTFIDSLNTLKGTKNLKSIYAVFNGVDMTKVNSGYGYSYGYGYGYYEDYK